MAVSKAEILDAIAGMTVLELAAVGGIIVFGLMGAADPQPAAVAASASSAAPPPNDGEEL